MNGTVILFGLLIVLNLIDMWASKGNVFDVIVVVLCVIALIMSWGK